MDDAHISEAMPLRGETPPYGAPPWIEMVIVAVFMSPVFAIVGFIGWKVVVSLMTQDADPTAIVGTPIALIVGGIFFSRYYWNFWTVPRLTVIRFTLDDRDNLTFTTLRDGEITVPAGSLVSLNRQLGYHAADHGRARPAQLLRGWWLRFSLTGWVYLPITNSAARELVRRLSAGSTSIS